MSDKFSAVKNPLTIIAIFSGIAEISGTAVLPLVAAENQKLFIWFLMIFPTYLVSLFFLLCIKNRAPYMRQVISRMREITWQP